MEENTPTRFLQVDTNILFICGGAFAGIDKVLNRSKSSSMGFEAEIKDKDERLSSEILKEIRPTDLVNMDLYLNLLEDSGNSNSRGS